MIVESIDASNAIEHPRPSLLPDESGLALSSVGCAVDASAVAVSCPFSPVVPSVGTALDTKLDDTAAADVPVGTVVVVVLGRVVFGTALAANPVVC